MRPQSTQGSKNYKTELYTLAASVMYLLTIFYFKCSSTLFWIICQTQGSKFTVQLCELMQKRAIMSVFHSAFHCPAGCTLSCIFSLEKVKFPKSSSYFRYSFNFLFSFKN